MEKFCIRSENIKENTFTSFDILRKDGDFFDVTLVSDDGYHIQAHKVILSASSKFFKENLKKTNHQNPMLFLSGFSEKILAPIVDYIYEGEVQVYQEDIQCFLKFANKLEIFGLTSDLIEIEKHNEEQQILVSKNDSQINVPIKKEELNEYPINSNVIIASEISNENPSLSKSSYDIPTASKSAKIILSPQKDSEDILSAKKSSNNTLPPKKDSKDILSGFKTSKNTLSVVDAKKAVDLLITKTNEGWECKRCGKCSNQNVNIRRHAETHIEGLSFECKKCYKIFGNRRALHNHKNRQCRA